MKSPDFIFRQVCSQVLETPGPGSSKLKMLLVNEVLKFQMLISQICQHFCFQQKYISVFGYKAV